MAWCSPRPKKEPSANILGQLKTLLIAFFDNEGIIHRPKEFVPADQTINAEFYQAVFNRILQRNRRVRPELYRTGKWMLLHDHAPANSAIRVRQFLAQNIVAVLPDLAPADFLFPRLKVAIKGARFADLNAIKDRVTVVLRSIPQEAFADCFRNLYERCQTCVVANCDYFEGQ